MSRIHANWLDAFLDFSSYAESPAPMRFWAGVSAIAGALRKKVWIDQAYFTWTPNFFIVLVAPPGIVSKSTTADMAMSLLREVPGIKFGPDVITWQALVQSLAGSCESFELDGEWHPMSPLTLVASELGNLINPLDRELINMYIHLWDGKKTVEKITKGSGNDIVEAPWVNMIGCTTPHWIADNMPPAVVGGGFTSRCIFVYADQKEKFVAYPKYHIPEGYAERRLSLIQDLEHIATNICGEYILPRASIEWGEKWYKNLWLNRPADLTDEKLDGYVARRQTHLHKLAMVLAASQNDDLIITPEHLEEADRQLQLVEKDMDMVFSKIGKSEEVLKLEGLVKLAVKKNGIPIEEAMRYLMFNFPDSRDLDACVMTLIRSNSLKMEQKGTSMWLYPGIASGFITGIHP